MTWHLDFDIRRDEATGQAVYPTDFHLKGPDGRYHIASRAGALDEPVFDLFAALQYPILKSRLKNIPWRVRCPQTYYFSRHPRVGRSNTGENCRILLLERPGAGRRVDLEFHQGNPQEVLRALRILLGQKRPGRPRKKRKSHGKDAERREGDEARTAPSGASDRGQGLQGSGEVAGQDR